MVNMSEYLELNLRCPKCRGNLTPRAVVGSDNIFGACDKCGIVVNPDNGETMPSYELSRYNLEKCIEMQKMLFPTEYKAVFKEE